MKEEPKNEDPKDAEDGSGAEDEEAFEVEAIVKSRKRKTMVGPHRWPEAHYNR